MSISQYATGISFHNFLYTRITNSYDPFVTFCFSCQVVVFPNQDGFCCHFSFFWSRGDMSKIPALRIELSFFEFNRSIPGASLTYFNDGGFRQRFIFYTQKIPTSEFVYPKKSLLFLAYPKKSLSVFASANFIIYLLES